MCPQNNTLQYHPCFSWAVPYAFRDALEFCRFEQGDVLYSTQDGYCTLISDPERDFDSIQIQSPPKLTGAKKNSDSKSVFHDNWDSGTSLIVYEHGKPKSKEIHSTQGRIYTTIWKGMDLSFLSDFARPCPEPFLAMDLIKNFPLITKKLLRDMILLYEYNIGFFMPYDATIQLLINKRKKIKLALDSFPVQYDEFFYPSYLINETVKHEHVPTSGILFIGTKDCSQKKFKAIIESALYEGSKPENASKTRMTSHGRIVTFPISVSMIDADHAEYEFQFKL